MNKSLLMTTLFSFTAFSFQAAAIPPLNAINPNSKLEQRENKKKEKKKELLGVSPDQGISRIQFESSGNCKNVISSATGSSCHLSNMVYKKGEASEVVPTEPGSYGIKSFGKDSIFCKECWSNLPQKNIKDKTGLKKFENDIKDKFRAKRVEIWNDRVAQIQSQMLLLDYHYSKNSLFSYDLQQVKKACNVNIQKTIENKFNEIISKYDKKDKDECPNYKNISTKKGIFNIFSNSDLYNRTKKNKSNEDYNTKKAKAAKELLSLNLPGLENAGINIHLNEKGEIDDQEKIARNFCNSNNVILHEANKFDEFKVYNLMVKNVANNSPSGFACDALASIRKDRRFGFDSFVDSDPDPSNPSCEIRGEHDKKYYDIFIKMYSDLLEKKGADKFKKSIGEDFDERNIYHKAVLDSLGDALSLKNGQVVFNFENKNKDNFSKLKDECNNLYNRDLETLICAKDNLDVNDQELILDLDEELLDCTSPTSSEATNSKCHNFMYFVCENKAPKNKDVDQDAHRAFESSNLYYRVNQFKERRQDESADFDKDYNYSCLNFANSCIGKTSSDLKNSNTLKDQNSIIFSCVKKSLSDAYRSRMKKDPNSMVDPVVARYLASVGEACDLMKGAVAKATCEEAAAVPVVAFNGCPGCVDDPVVNNGIDEDIARDLVPGGFNFPGSETGSSSSVLADSSVSTANSSESGIKNDPVVNPNIVPSTAASSVVDQLKNQVSSIDKDLSNIKKKNDEKGNDPLKDPDYLAKLAQKEALDKQLKELESSIAKAKDQKTINELKRELEDAKNALAKSKQSKNMKSSENNSATSENGSSASQNTNKNKFNANNFGDTIESPVSNGVVGGQLAGGKFVDGVSSGQDYSSSIGGGGGLSNPSGSSSNSSSRQGTNYSLGVNGVVRNVSNEIIEKLKKQNDIPVLTITSEEIAQINHDPEFLKLKCPSCYERGIFKAIIEDGEVGKNIAYLSVKKDGKYLIPETKRAPAGAVDKKPAEPVKTIDKSNRVRVKKEDMDKIFEEGTK